jgi:hypothetical protein
LTVAQQRAYHPRIEPIFNSRQLHCD